MAEREILREFLVKLGVVTDEAALRKFKDGIGQATKSVLTFGAAAAATASTLAWAMQKFSANLEQLYFSSLRTNTSVRNLKALETAAQNLGANAGEATQAVESLAQAFMRNPIRTEALLRQMGVHTRDSQGNLRGWKDMLLETQEWFQRMPTQIGTQRADMLSIPYNVYLELQKGQLQSEVARVNKQLGGINWQQMAEGAHAFEESVRSLANAFEYLGGQINEHLAKRFKISMESVTDYLSKHGDETAGKIDEVIDSILDLIDTLKPQLKWLYEQYTALDAKTNGWLTGTVGILLALNLLGATNIVTGVAGLAVGVASLGAQLIGASVAAGPLLVALTAIAAAAAWMSNKEKFPKSLGQAWSQFKWNTGRATTYLGQGGASGVGLSPEQKSAAAHFKSMLGLTDEQTRAMVGVLGQESGVNLDPEARGDSGRAWGIGQWHADRQAQFWSFMKTMGISESQFHALKDPARKRSYEESFIGRELTGSEKPVFDALMKSGDYRQAFDVFGGYERSATWQAAFPGGLKDVQGVTINFNGPVTDSAAVTKAVKDAIAQSQQQLGAQISRDATLAH